MDEAKGRNLERAGWKLGTPKEFLGLTDEETALIEIKVALARGIKERRLSLRAHTGRPREANEIEPVSDREDGGLRHGGVHGFPGAFATCPWRDYSGGRRGHRKKFSGSSGVDSAAGTARRRRGRTRTVRFRTASTAAYRRRGAVPSGLVDALVLRQTGLFEDGDVGLPLGVGVDVLLADHELQGVLLEGVLHQRLQVHLGVHLLGAATVAAALELTATSAKRSHTGDASMGAP